MRKSWKKIWPALSCTESSEQHNETENLKFIQQVPGCEEADETDIKEWMSTVGASDENLTDKEIVVIVTQEDTNSMRKRIMMWQVVMRYSLWVTQRCSGHWLSSPLYQITRQHYSDWCMFMRHWWNIMSSDLQHYIKRRLLILWTGLTINFCNYCTQLVIRTSNKTYLM